MGPRSTIRILNETHLVNRKTDIFFGVVGSEIFYRSMSSVFGSVDLAGVSNETAFEWGRSRVELSDQRIRSCSVVADRTIYSIRSSRFNILLPRVDTLLPPVNSLLPPVNTLLHPVNTLLPRINNLLQQNSNIFLKPFWTIFDIWKFDRECLFTDFTLYGRFLKA